ncbi:hypothetical protein Scep_012397 [Stephania cephalantha]|uniref:Uncharacterized protein n=1 Tax=Stephania cephalantha TaxID=152367 RepID=A0AAP0JF19_9MAGN
MNLITQNHWCISAPAFPPCAQGGLDNHRVKWKWMRFFNNDRDCWDLITSGRRPVCAKTMLENVNCCSEVQ